MPWRSSNWMSDSESLGGGDSDESDDNSEESSSAIFYFSCHGFGEEVSGCLLEDERVGVGVRRAKWVWRRESEERLDGEGGRWIGCKKLRPRPTLGPGHSQPAFQ